MSAKKRSSKKNSKTPPAAKPSKEVLKGKKQEANSETEKLELTGTVTPEQAATETIVEESEIAEAPADEVPEPEVPLTEDNPTTAEELGKQAVRTEIEPEADKIELPELPIESTEEVKQKNRRMRLTTVLTSLAGLAAIITLIMAGLLNFYFKDKTLPNVFVAGISSSGKTEAELKDQLTRQKDQLKITFTTPDGKVLEPKTDEIGVVMDIEQTVANAMFAKRDEGLLTQLMFWKKASVPVAINISDSLLGQYTENNVPEYNKPATDSQLRFNEQSDSFEITDQAPGQGVNTFKLKNSIKALGANPVPASFKIEISAKEPNLTKEKLTQLIEPAEKIIQNKVVLTSQYRTFVVSRADIASWLTAKPLEDGGVELIVDDAKITSFVENVGKQISAIPRDRKVIKDSSGKEIVIQEGRDGTELADRQGLAGAITAALKENQDITQVMTIQTAGFKTVSMDTYDKWVEVDLSEQSMTVYEHATAVRRFIVATGMRGYETPPGEYAVWLKVRKQTMTGGSKASGDYYSIPNVEWVNYFYGDYAIHGAWWRKVYGYPASHGCVNVSQAEAEWLYSWMPIGTKVIVHV